MKVPWSKTGYPETVNIICDNCGNAFIAPKGTGATWCKPCWMKFGYDKGVVSESKYREYLESQK